MGILHISSLDSVIKCHSHLRTEAWTPLEGTSTTDTDIKIEKDLQVDR